ncbi:UNKNOWN [Stylonychia lemnae]|uniref:Uncharacterized protein n=1 Tax=Stylonychia lemnae TaxID=5949 RepID=A0A077ZXN5_STYLE|nr:UNKNOWN [Stylonychia lemnae]|eukprot:CDW74311.1 UNKNOWN [Stylonychia lemnae]
MDTVQYFYYPIGFKLYQKYLDEDSYLAKFCSQTDKMILFNHQNIENYDYSNSNIINSRKIYKFSFQLSVLIRENHFFADFKNYLNAMMNKKKILNDDVICNESVEDDILGKLLMTYSQFKERNFGQIFRTRDAAFVRKWLLRIYPAQEKYIKKLGCVYIYVDEDDLELLRQNKLLHPLFYKIGFTTRDPRQRVMEEIVKCQKIFILVDAFYTYYPEYLEFYMHCYFHKQRLRVEYDNPKIIERGEGNPGLSECFQVSYKEILILLLKLKSYLVSLYEDCEETQKFQLRFSHQNWFWKNLHETSANFFEQIKEKCDQQKI